MVEVLPLSESELRLLGSLVRHKVRFIVVGLSAAALQGAPVVTEDVDLWFENLNDPQLARALRAVGAAYIPPFQLNPPMLGGSGTELFDVVLRMDGLRDFSKEFESACEVRIARLRLKVLPLDRILASKQAANRPKDKLVIPVLQNVIRTLAVRSTAARKKHSGTKSKRRKLSRRKC